MAIRRTKPAGSLGNMITVSAPVYSLDKVKKPMLSSTSAKPVQIFEIRKLKTDLLSTFIVFVIILIGLGASFLVLR